MILNQPIELRLSEIVRETEIPDIDFSILPLPLKRRIATYILLRRGDRASLDMADLLRANNPNVTSFTVVDDARQRRITHPVRRLDRRVER